MGKAYANRKKEEDRPDNDFYQTPKCMTWELLNTHLIQEQYPVTDKSQISILEPCCGKYAITNESIKYGYTNIVSRDLIYGNDFLKDDLTKERYDCIIMNPPFKLFDSFVNTAKEISPYICSIGKLNYFGSHSRNINGLWEHLEWVLPFDRQIAFDKPFREDGKVECGMMISGWFIWNKFYEGLPKIKVLDMQKYILTKYDLE